MTPKRFDLDDWSIVPGGPAIRPPFESIDLYEATDYELETAAAAILSVPGTQLVHDQNPNWWEWRARWSFDGAVIDVEMTTADGPDGLIWGGSALSGLAEPVHLGVFYRGVHEVLRCAWLHNSACELHTSESFSAKYGAG